MKSKAKVKRQKAKAGKRSPAAIFVLFLFAFFFLPCFVWAAPSQQEVLRSINESVGHEIDESSLLVFVLAIVTLILVLVIITHRRQRAVVPKEINHPGKLLKEVSRSIQLKPAEVRQLKMLAEGWDISSPLVLMLCPSLMAKAVKENADRIDRRVVGTLAQKIGPDRGGTKTPDSQ